MSDALPLPAKGTDPAQILALGTSFMSSRFLGAGVELNLFEHLADRPLTLEELTSVTGLPAHALRVLANGLVSLEMLELRDGHYANSVTAQAYLTGRTTIDLRPGLRLFNRVVYPMWIQFENTIRTGEPARRAQASDDFARLFSEGVEAWTSVTASTLPDRYDFSRHHRLLDVGGGTGSYLVPILKRHAEMRATLFELPPSADVARSRLASQPTRSRIEIVEGDALFDPLPGGHDIVLLAAVVHLFDPEKTMLLLRRIRESVSTGATLLLVDHWMNSTHVQPQMGAILAGTYLLFSGHAASYSLDEAQSWLAQTGWRFVSFQHVAGEHSLIVAEAE
ncbi:MAG TPA: methyltransferase [Polyangiaceae bacterium]